MKSQLPTAKIRTALWVEELKCHLRKIDNKNGKFGFDDFSRMFTQEFQRYSSKKAELPPHIKTQLVLLTGHVRENSNSKDELEYCLYKNDLFLKEIYKDISKPSFSNWRNGKTSPNPLIQQIAKQIHEKSALWFSSDEYHNRLSRFLYVVDLAHDSIISKKKEASIEKLNIVFSQISKEWRPIKRTQIDGQDKTIVRDFYIPGPSERHCFSSIEPYIGTSILRDIQAKRTNRNWSTWQEFESLYEIEFDLSLSTNSYCGLAVGRDIYSKYNQEKPYATFFMMISLMLSDELRDAKVKFSTDLILDLCAACICIIILSKNSPNSKFELTQYHQGSLLTFLPQSILSFYFNNCSPFDITEVSYSFIYDVRDACSEIAGAANTAIRKTLEKEFNGVKPKLTKEGYNCGQDYHYSVLDRCLNLRKDFVRDLDSSVYDSLFKIAMPQISKILKSKHVRLDFNKFDMNYCFENYGVSRGLVNAYGS